MNHLELLIPFGLPTTLADDLKRQLKVPAFATLLARAKHLPEQSFDGFSRALPHEAWLAQRLGLAPTLVHDTSPAVAGNAMQQFGLQPESGTWFILNPAHLHVARDHLVLPDLRQLSITDGEARALFATAEPLFAELGKTLVYGDARTWFMRADDWANLKTATPDAACGHNIDIWMPKGEGERDWRKLQNEVQMAWHFHPTNEQRAARGASPINSIWPWGATAIEASASVAIGLNATSAHPQLFNFSGWTPAEQGVAAVHSVKAANLIGIDIERGLLILDELTEPALAGDWGLWLQHFHQLEKDRFLPLLEAVRSGKLNQLSLIMSHGTRLATFDFSKQSTRKFWATPSLARLTA